MSRIRSIKPGFFRDVDLGELPVLARVLFAGLWTEADREGRLADKPRQLKADLLPFDECDPDALLALLAAAGFITRYEANGHRYLAIHNWAKHQVINVREPASTIPALCENSTGTVPVGDARAQVKEWKGKERKGVVHTSQIAPEIGPLCDTLAASVHEKVPTARVKPETWVHDFDLLHRIDKAPWPEIEETLAWTVAASRGNGKFPGWAFVILSAKKLRQHYTEIRAQMAAKGHSEPGFEP